MTARTVHLASEPAVSQLSLLDGVELKPKSRLRVPFRHESDTSEAAAATIAPSFRGNMAICYKSIVASAPRGGCTRKQLAEWHFEGMQNYVTGPVDRLIHVEGLVYEVPMKNADGVILRRDDGSIIPKRLDGSALLMPARGGDFEEVAA